MSKIEELINRLCPDGVEFKKLGEVCKVLRGKRLTTRDLSSKEKYPVFHGGNIPIGYYHTYNRTANSTMVINVGASAGTIGYSNVDFWSSDGCFCFSYNECLIQKYLFYYLQSIEQFIKSRVRKAGIPTLDNKVLERVSIPIPPLEIQQEIVRILDNFTELTNELTNELTARKKQYEYYRDKLLTFDKDDDKVKWMKLGEIGTFIRGNGLQKKDFTETGFPCIHYGQIHTHYGTSTDSTISYTSYALAEKLRKASYGNLIIATTSEDVNGVCKACAWLGKTDVAVSGDAYIYRHNQNPKYISYMFQTKLFYEYKKRAATGTKVIRVSGDSMNNFEIPIPSLETQQRIVSILDRFDQLCNDLTAGLPAEIEARRKQYEYYRDKLLTFKEKKA